MHGFSTFPKDPGQESGHHMQNRTISRIFVFFLGGGDLVSLFNGISIFVDYLMPKLFS